MSDLNNIDDELLSAYLDDELPPDERARVDARLAADPAARLTLEQLRAASQAVQSLPHETVGEDLRESILRRAEAAMLTSNGGAPAGSSASTADEVVSLPLPRITIGQTRRGWVWAGLALAAGLLIMVLQPGDEPGGELGQVAASKRRESVDKLAIADRADVPELRNLPAAEPAAPPAPADHDSYAEVAMAPATSAPVASGGVPSPQRENLAWDAAATPAVPAPAAPPAASSTLSEAGDRVLKEGAEDAIVVRAPAQAERYGGRAERPADESGTLAGGPALRQLGDQERKSKDANGSLSSGVENGTSPPSAASSERELAATPPQGAVGGEPRLGMATTGQPAAAGALAKAPAPAAEDDFLVVHVVVNPEALGNDAFDKLLAKNGIVVEEAVEEQSAAERSLETRAAKRADDRYLNRSGGKAGEESGKMRPEDMVLVAAPRATIEAFLSELKQDQVNYFGVAVDDPTAKAPSSDGDGKSLGNSAPRAKTLAADFGTRFNRGSVPSQEVESTRGLYFYDAYAGRGEGAAGRGGFGGGGGAGGAQRGAVMQDLEQQSAGGESSEFGVPITNEQLGRGRARRIRSPGFDDQTKRDGLVGREAVVDGRISSKAPRQFGAEVQRAQAPAEAAAGDRLNVLFVLSPGTESPANSAPSRPAENRQE